MTSWMPIELMPAAWSVGWTLLHFVWQAALVAAVTSLVLLCLGRRSPQARYAVCCAALLVMAAIPVVTFLLDRSAQSGQAASAGAVTAAVTEGFRDQLASWLPVMTLTWLAGVWLMQARLVVQLAGARTLRKQGLLELPAQWTRTVTVLCGRLGIRRAVAAYESTLAQVPMVVGWLRPVVLVPTAALAGLAPQQLQAVLAHELAHVRRHDALVNLAQTVFESLFFFHPAVWWLSNRLRIEREFCCDDVAVHTCGDSLTYAKALAELDALRGDALQPALAATGGSLMQRIARLLEVSQPSRGLGGWIVPMVMTLSLTAVVSAMSIAGDPEPQAQDEQSPTGPTLAGIDLVEIVSGVDAEQGMILSLLREAGLDDTVLLSVVTDMGTDPKVIEAIQVATERAGNIAEFKQMKEKAERVLSEVKQQLEQGLITEEEASLRAHDVKRELELFHRRFGVDSPHGGDHGQLHERHSMEKMGSELKKKVAHLKEMAHEIRSLIEVGELTPEEGQAKMEHIELQMKEIQQRHEKLHDEYVELHGAEHRVEVTVAEKEAHAKRKQAARSKLEGLLAAGLLSQEQAEKALHKLEYLHLEHEMKLRQKKHEDEKKLENLRELGYVR